MGSNGDPSSLALSGGATDEFDPFNYWDTHESMDSLKWKLFYTTLELESVKGSLKGMVEEMKGMANLLQRKEEENNQLSHILNVTMQEKDSAMQELQKLMTKSNIQQTTAAQVDFHCSMAPVTPQIQMVVTDDIVPGSVTTISDPSINLGMVQDDEWSRILDNLVMNRALPEKGKMVQAVQAWPLLDEIAMTGTLPKWKNPPCIALPLMMTPQAVGSYGSAGLGFLSRAGGKRHRGSSVNL